VAQLARRRRLEARRLGRTAPAGAEGEAPKRARPVSAGSSSRESAKVAPEPQEGASEVVPPGGWPKSVSHGGLSVIGRRREMEDAFAVAAPFLLVKAAAGKEEEESGEGEEKEKEKDGGGGEAEAEAEAEVEFFAVYDGHGGPRVADTCRERLHVVLAEEVARLHLQLGKGGGGDDGGGVLRRWREAMEACFARVDGEVVVVEREVNKNKNNAGDTVGCGSTAVVAVVGPRHIVVANCGDSRAVLSRGGVPMPLSSDHKVLTSVQHPAPPPKHKFSRRPAIKAAGDDDGGGKLIARQVPPPPPQIRIDFLESLAMRLRELGTDATPPSLYLRTRRRRRHDAIALPAVPCRAVARDVFLRPGSHHRCRAQAAKGRRPKPLRRHRANKPPWLWRALVSKRQRSSPLHPSTLPQVSFRFVSSHPFFLFFFRLSARRLARLARACALCSAAALCQTGRWHCRVGLGDPWIGYFLGRTACLPSAWRMRKD